MTNVPSMSYKAKSESDAYAQWVSKTLGVDESTGLEYFGDLVGKTVVDFGCGAGGDINSFCAKKAYCLGIDANEAMIRSGGIQVVDETEFSLQRQLDNKQQALAIVKDCFKPFDRTYGQFDFASCNYCVQYCSDDSTLQILLNNILNQLKPSGKLFIGQPPFLAANIRDQDTIADTIGVLYKLKTEAKGQDPFFCSSVALKPLPDHISETGRPFTRDRLFTFEDYFWSKEKVMENLKKAGFVNIKLLEPCFPKEATDEEKMRIRALEEPFVFIGAEKPHAVTSMSEG